MALTFGQRLQQARLNAKMTQKDLALELGNISHKPKISDWEQDRYALTLIEDFLNICTILSVDPYYLYFGDE